MNKKPSLALLDRLLEANNEALTPSISTNEELSENIRINLENLLNTRRPFLSFDPRYKQLRQSTINYGIDDFSSIWLDSLDGYEPFARQVQQAISFFESRLRNVSVSLEEDPNQLTRTLRLRIEGEMKGIIENQLISYHANLTSSDAFLSLRTSKIMELVDV